MSKPTINNLHIQFLQDEIIVEFDITHADPGVYDGRLNHTGYHFTRTVMVNGTRQNYGVKLHYKMHPSKINHSYAKQATFTLVSAQKTTGITGDVEPDTKTINDKAYDRAMKSI